MARAAGLLMSLALAGGSVAEPVSIERQHELRELLHQDCGSCHGMRLTGGLGPPLTAQALQGKSRELLIATVSEGRAGTPMPPWGFEIGRDEATWLVERMKEGL